MALYPSHRLSVFFAGSNIYNRGLIEVMALNGRSDALKVQVTEIPSEGIDLSGDVTFEELEIECDEVTQLPWPVSYRLHLSQLGEDLLVSGSVRAPVLLMCDRCAEFSRHELPESDVCHRYENVAGEVVDLTDDLREDILIAFPQSHLCSEDCLGLCPECGSNLNEVDCGCVREVAEFDEAEGEENPWAALDGLQLDEQ